MRVLWGALSVACLAPATVGAVRADDQAEMIALLDKGIKALGGEATLKKYQAATWKGTATGYGPEGKSVATAEWSVQGPEQYRREAEIEVLGQNAGNTVEVINGKEGWVKALDNKVRPLDKESFPRVKVNRLYAHWVTTLVPLKDKAFKLSPFGEVKIGDRPAVGITVSRKGYPDITLCFDKETGVLLKSETVIELDSGTDDEIGKTVTEERLYTDYRETDGVRRARKVTAKVDGKLRWELEISEFKPHEKLDDSVFAKP